MQDSIKLGRLGGVRIGANWSLFALVGLVAYLLATSSLPGNVPGYPRDDYWLAAILTAVALFVGVLVHELAHAVAAKRAKLRVDGITLWFMGGLTRIEDDSGSASTELVVAIVGPLASGALGGLALAASALAGSAGWSLAAGSLRWLGAINLLLGVFNLLPASPLDGGRVLHGLLWLTTHNRWLSTRLAAGAGVVLGAACAFGGFLALEQGDVMDGVVVLAMGWFVLASAKREQLTGRAQHVLGDALVSDIMRRAVIAPGWLTVGAFWNEWASVYPDAAFLLERWGGDGWGGGDWVGVVTAQQLAAVPPAAQWTIRAQDIALPLAGTSQAPQAAPPGFLGRALQGAAGTGAAGTGAAGTGAAAQGPAPLSPDQPAMAIAGHPGIAMPVEDHGATVGLVLAPDVAAMVARGTPVPRRTWGTTLWPAPSASSRYA